MKYFLRLRIPLLFLLIAAFAGCDDTPNNEPDDNTANVRGVWVGDVTIQSCLPAEVCDSIQLPTGPIVASMQLSQASDRVEGVYSYPAILIRANVTGVVNVRSLSLSGTAIQTVGQATVQLTGTVGTNTIQANIEHRISLIDGRTATATGTGTFVFQ